MQPRSRNLPHSWRRWWITRPVCLRARLQPRRSASAGRAPAEAFPARSPSARRRQRRPSASPGARFYSVLGRWTAAGRPTTLESNYGLTAATLLRANPAFPENIHRIAGEPPPAEAARRYGAELRAFIEQRPAFDSGLSGHGGVDGHNRLALPGARPR